MVKQVFLSSSSRVYSLILVIGFCLPVLGQIPLCDSTKLQVSETCPVPFLAQDCRLLEDQGDCPGGMRAAYSAQPNPGYALNPAYPNPDNDPLHKYVKQICAGGVYGVGVPVKNCGPGGGATLCVALWDLTVVPPVPVQEKCYDNYQCVWSNEEQACVPSQRFCSTTTRQKNDEIPCYLPSVLHLDESRQLQ